jgi:cytochrome c
MYKNKLNISVLLAGVVFASSSFAADAPAAPAAPATEAPAAAVVAPAAVAPAAPAAATAAPAEAAAVATAPAADAAPAVVADPVLSEAEGLALLKKSGCTVCHSIPKKVVGPAYKDVAAKYRGQDGAEAKLIAKVTKGGNGVWGAVPMPSQQKAGEATIKSLVRFILALK